MNSIDRLPRGRGGLAALILTLVTLAGCGGGEDATAEQNGPVPVVLGRQDVATAQITELASGVVLTGSLEPAEILPLRAQVEGTIGSVRVDRGSPVRKGQVMAVIEAAGVRSQAAGARAGVAAAEANLAVARQQRDAARDLHAAGATSAIDLRSAEAGYEAAEAQLAAARAQAAGAIEQAGRATITAPITGVVSERSIEPGQPVRMGDELFTVVNSEYLELDGQIPVDQAGGVQVGQPVVFTLTAFPGREFKGEVARIDPTADPRTRQVGVYVRLRNPDQRIVGGQFARGRIVSDRVAEALVVPETAVRGTGDSTFVLAVADGKVARKPVTVGARDEASGMIAVTDGLRAGEQVITTPAANLTEGTPVTLPGAPAAATATAQAGDTVSPTEE